VTKNNFVEEIGVCNISRIKQNMTVLGKIGGTNVNFLVDTGASCTLISETVYNRLRKAEKFQLGELTDRKFQLADGTPLSTQGKLNVEIQLGPVVVKHEIIVASISDEGIIGYDFLKIHGCKIDIGKDELQLLGRKVPCTALEDFHSNESLKCENAHAVADQESTEALDSGCSSLQVLKIKETVEIIAGSEQLVEVTLNGSYKRLDHPVIVEPLPKFEERYNMKLATALIDPKAEQTVVRILNPHKESVTLHQHSEVATVDEIDQCYFLDQEDEETITQEMAVRSIGDTSLGPSDVEEMKTENAALSQELPEHLEDLYNKSTQDMKETDAALVWQLLVDYQTVFAKDKNDLGRLHSKYGEHEILTGDAAPVRQRPYRTPTAFKGVEEQEIDRMQKMGVIRKSTSPWASPIVLVKKKDGSTRFCVNYTRLNKLTLKDSYPLPRIDDCLESLAGSNRFSTMDLASGYWQIPMKECDKPKTAFITKSGLWEFNVLPFGLTNAPGTFERTMETILRGCQWKTCLIYLDDIIVFAPTHEEHVRRLRQVLARIKEAGLKLKPSKCEFFQESLIFLGHKVTSDGLTADPAKIEAVVKWSTPKTVKDVRSFLGFCSYYRRYIPGIAEISAPLCKLTQKQQKFNWTEECEASFEQLKAALINSPVLAYPRDDGLYILDTDASDEAVGAVLSQIQPPSEDFEKWSCRKKTCLEKTHGGEEKVISYASRVLTRAEKNYCVTRRELLAVVTFIKQYRHFLLGRKFMVRTDHRPLVWLFHLRDPTGQIARWQEILASYDFEILYRPGEKHGNADGLSRSPHDTADDEELELPCGICRKCENQSAVETCHAVTRSQVKQESALRTPWREKDN